jgi:hypothetical protein
MHVTTSRFYRRNVAHVSDLKQGLEGRAFLTQEGVKPKVMILSVMESGTAHCTLVGKAALFSDLAAGSVAFHGIYLDSVNGTD